MIINQICKFCRLFWALCGYAYLDYKIRKKKIWMKFLLSLLFLSYDILLFDWKYLLNLEKKNIQCNKLI